MDDRLAQIFLEAAREPDVSEKELGHTAHLYRYGLGVATMAQERGRAPPAPALLEQQNRFSGSNEL